MITKVKEYNEKHQLFKQGDKIIVGVSGGKDSVCLLHLLNSLKDEMNLTLMVVHVNHGLRGEAADEDADFVEKISRKMGLRCHVENVNIKEIAKVKRISEEEAGRFVRYDTMEVLRLENQFDSVAVAHHQDDVAETVLFNLVRGTGPKGLSGISAKRDAVIRPILFAEAEEILDYIHENGLEYREDATNYECMYTRNKIRRQVFPFLEKEINARAKAHVAEAAKRIALQNDYIEKQAKKAYLEVVQAENDEYHYTMEQFSELERVIQSEVIRLVLGNLIQNAKDVDQSHYRMILELKEKKVGKRISLPENVVVERTYEGVRFYMANEENEEDNTKVRYSCFPPCTYKVTAGDSIYQFTFSLCENREELGEIPEKDYTKWFDYDKIKSGILLRTPEEGDFLSIDRIGRRKKLSRYFIDEKVPAKQRDSELILADKKHVLWVISSGRISQTYKVTVHTKRVLVVTKERIM